MFRVKRGRCAVYLQASRDSGRAQVLQCVESPCISTATAESQQKYGGFFLGYGTDTKLVTDGDLDKTRFSQR